VTTIRPTEHRRLDAVRSFYLRGDWGNFRAWGLMLSKGAPQEAAAAAMGLAFAVIPYVIFKTFAVTRANAQRDRIIELLEQQAKT